MNGGSSPRVPHVSSLSFPGVPSDALVVALDLEGICVSGGSACSAGTQSAGAAVRAMLGEERASSTVRVSLGEETTDADIDAFIEAVRRQ